MKHVNSIRIDASVLGQVGLDSLDGPDARAALEGIRSELDVRILGRLRPAMSAGQSSELDYLIAEDAEGVVEHFLDRSFPGHRQVAAEELADLIRRLSAGVAIDRALSGVSPIYHDAFARLDAEAEAD